MTDDITPANAPWYQSAILRGCAIVAITRILARFHIGDVTTAGLMWDTVLDLGSLAGAGYAAWSRFKHPLPTLTATKAKADAANAAASISPNGDSNAKANPDPAPPAAVPPAA